MVTSFKTLTLPNISGKIYYGYCPSELDLQELKYLNVDTVWNLATELNTTYLREKELFSNVIFSAIEDYSIPTSFKSFNEDLTNVMNSLNNGKNIFVHCLGGHGRTGIALSLILISLGFFLDEAFEKTYQLCRGPEVEEQKEFVKNFSEKFLCLK